MALEANISKAAALLAKSQRLAVLTGAGVSKESEIPTFREPGEGIWASYDPVKVASISGFIKDPDISWQWHEHLRKMVTSAGPNAGHLALAALERFLPGMVVITQNIDDLHQRAGSTDVLPIHGSLSRNRCFQGCRGNPTYLDWDDLEDYRPTGGVPHCPYCGSWVRPDVVWFGEALPEALISRAFEVCRQADVLLVVGTSGVIQPAASLPWVAQEAHAWIIDINPNRNGLTDIVDVWLQGPSAELLPRLLAAVQGMLDGSEGLRES